MSERVALALSITVRSPFMFQGLVNARLGVDAATLRDERDRPIIPADQARGVVRMALEALGGAPPNRSKDEKARPGRAPSVISEAEILALFGDESPSASPQNSEQDRPARGRLHFGDLVGNRECERALATTRIEIDDDLGAVKSGAVQVVELAADIGTDVVFSGSVMFDVAATLTAERVRNALSKALKLIPAIGAFKSAGFGEVIGTSIEIEAKKPSPVLTTAAWTGGATRRAYRITFDRPILVDATRVTDNLFTGADVVPGAALKGALAERLRAAGFDPENAPIWSDALANLRISHAFPQNGAGVPFGFRLPASVLCGYPNDKRTFADALLAASDAPGSEGFVFGQPAAPTIGRFPIDWKGEEPEAFTDGGKRFPVYETLPELPRVHVAIDRNALVAIDQKLFATIAKGARNEVGNSRVFRFVVDAERAPDECRESLFAALEAGLGPIGRTDAFTQQVEEIGANEAPKDKFDALRLAPAPELDPVRSDSPNLFALTLLTPALMIDPRVEKNERDRYAEYWRSACDAELVTFFASRSLAGGYIAMRRRLYGDAYYPFALVGAGSVFLLKNPNKTRLAALLRHGLEPAVFRGAGGGARALDWRNCPYLPQNGFGEIACNLVDHAALSKDVCRV